MVNMSYGWNLMPVQDICLQCYDNGCFKWLLGMRFVGDLFGSEPVMVNLGSQFENWASVEYVVNVMG